MSPTRISRRALLQASGALVSLALPFPAFGQSRPDRRVVETAHGRIRGVTRDGVRVFRGIRYAAPPIGPLRFAAPVQPATWSGIVETTATGPRAPQPPRIMIPEMGDALTGSGPTGEDCLRLHVWAPEAPAPRGRPVVVFFHGGGWRSGSANSPFYDGWALARQHDVVVVTVNHRLSALGYLYLRELGGDQYAQSGNAGLLDLVASLQWVRANITAFGGDPGCVTLMGQSGGGGKVSMLMAAPAAAGLFHRAIIMSTIIESGVRALEPAAASASAARLLERLNISPARLDALQRMPVERIMSALPGASGIASGTMPVGNTSAGDITTQFYPVVDGLTLPAHPFDPVAPSVSGSVPVLCGANETEGVPYADLQDPFWQGEITTDDALRDRVRRVLNVGAAEADTVIDLYRRNRPRDSRQDLALIIAADNSPTRLAPAVFADRKHAQGEAQAFMYSFAWRSPVRNGKLRSMHSMELPFLFNHPGDLQFMVGAAADNARLAATMSGAFMQFARTGVPAAPGLPEWRPYDPARRPTMVFDTASTLVDDPHGDERRALEGLRRRAAGVFLTAHLHFLVSDVDATARFWIALGARRAGSAESSTLVLSTLEIRLVQGVASGSSDGSVVNHVALRTPDLAPLLATLAAAGVRTERPAQFPGTANAFTPDGDKVEIFDNTSPYPAFEADGQAAGTAWRRHNQPVTASVAHHVHFYIPAGQEKTARDWYAARFGGTRGVRLRYDALDHEAINLNFSAAPAPAAPTAGRTLNRIGFGVTGLEVLASTLVAQGTDVLLPYARTGRVGRLVFRDPWGTTVELREELP